MSKQEERELEEIKTLVKDKTSKMDSQSAAEFMSDLADWAYAEMDNFIYDDEI